MTNLPKVYIGVDVSKKTLDIHVYPIGKMIKIDNTKSGINSLIKQLNQYEIVQIACESTGGYEKLLCQVFGQNNYKVWIVDPRRIKGFIISSGCRSKTDKIDAKKIAEFASKNTKDYDAFEKTNNQEHLLALVNRKNDLTKFLGVEKTRLKHPSHALSEASIKRFIKVLEKEIKSIDKQMQELIKQDKDLNKKSEILESIPGIGKATAAVLLSAVPELGQISNKEASALIGVCPYDNQSGKHNGKKFVKGGRQLPRNALYMCALTTIKYSFALKEFYNRLRITKPFKVAMVAVMHKLVILANSLIKKGELCKV
jgi:transposase